MPNSNSEQPSRFYGYVLTYYRNDPYLMLDKFASLIADVAAEVSIDWYETRSCISLSGELIKDRGVVGIEKADKGRISVVAFENSYTWEDENQEYTIKYPSIRFNNFRKHFPEPVLFDGYKALMDEFDSYRGGARVSRVKSNANRKNEILQAAAKRREDEITLRDEAVGKDFRWLKMLVKLECPCPYFARKGVGELHKVVDLFTGETTMGNCIGRFTALRLFKLKEWSFNGLQRIYPETNQKTFRRGLNTSEACFPIPCRQPINGETIYVNEAPADAGMAFKLTGCYSVAAMYADNIPLIVNVLRSLCPDSEIIIVADNDQYDGGNNKGVEVCELALRETEGATFMIIPQFDESEKVKKYKELTDFSSAYGEDKAKNLLVSYK